MEPGAVIEQLIIRYGTITRKEMAANLAKLELPWNPDGEYVYARVVFGSTRQDKELHSIYTIWLNVSVLVWPWLFDLLGRPAPLVD
jgi:hypothetical protein